MTLPRHEDRELRSLFQGLPREGLSRTSCPPPEDLWVSARGELAEARSREVIAHTGQCPDCAEEWRLARSLVRETDAAPAVTAAPATRPRRYRQLAAAAGILLSVGIGSLWYRDRFDDRDAVFRDQDRPQIEALTPEDRPLSRRQPVLRWRGPAGATYRLVVTTARLQILVRLEGLTERRYQLPEQALDALPPGSTLLWQIETTLPDGSRLPSRTFRVRLE